MRRLWCGLAAVLLGAAALGATGASDAGAPSAAAPGFEAISPEVAAALAAKAAGRPVEAGRWMVAAANPHAVNRYGPYELEAGTAMAGMRAALASLGYLVESRPLHSGLHAISIGPGGLRGGADPRREGIALGH